MQVLKSFNHPNVVRCKETFTEAGRLCIVMEYCSEGQPAQFRTAADTEGNDPSFHNCQLHAGDLHAALKKRKNMPMSESLILDWFVQICLGLKHVHDRKVLHRYALNLLLFKCPSVEGLMCSLQVSRRLS